MFGFLKRKKPPGDQGPPAAPPIPETLPDSPDGPQPFGYKTVWLAVKSDDPAQVAQVLGLRTAGPVNWASGLALAYERADSVFLSPALDGYVLAVGLSEEYSPEQIAALSVPFDDLQYFASHRVVDLYSWARAARGDLLRGYSYCGERGEVQWQRGEMTAEERALDFQRFRVDDDIWETPDEEDVLRIAAAWGLDPTFGDKDYPVSLGTLCQKCQ